MPSCSPWIKCVSLETRGILLSELGQLKAFGEVILGSLELGTKYLEPRQLSEGKYDFTLMILMQGNEFEDLSEDLFEDLSDNESECDMPVGDDFSSKNEGLDDIVSISPGKEFDHLDTILDSVQYLLNRANTIIFLIEEFAGKLAPIDPIPPRIVKVDPGEDIRQIEKLLNDDSFPHSPEELKSEIPDAFIESFSPSPILDEDKLLNNDYISLPEYESFHVDFYNVPSSTHPPEKPPEGDDHFDIEPDTRVLTTKVVDDISDNSKREL
ncbi:hypothetical protein Tco_0997413 [Tanacetum coccineum]